MPIPLNDDKALLENQAAVYHRTLNSLSRLKHDQHKLQDCLISMKGNIDAGFVEPVPYSERIPSTNKAWWLPIFSVYNIKEKTRLVYDASAKYRGVSLHDCMLQGPDYNNPLRDALIRFREKHVAFISDIEKMFNSFGLPENQNNCYRFFWFDNRLNDSSC